MSKWDQYDSSVGDDPHPFVVGAVERYATARDTALDLGAGNLRHTTFLLKNGFKKVIAVDEEIRGQSNKSSIEIVTMRLQEFVPGQQSCSFVLCWATLFFLAQSEVPAIFDRVYAALKPGGIFVCNVLGEKDDWVVGRVRGRHYATAVELENYNKRWVQLAHPREDRHYDKNKKSWHVWELVLGRSY